MTIAITFDEEWEVEASLSWCHRFARASDEELLVLVLATQQSANKQKAAPRVVDVDGPDGAETTVGAAVLDGVQRIPQLTTSEGPQNGQTKATIVELIGGNQVETVLEQANARGVSLLIIPRHATDRGLDPELEWERELFLAATCQAMLLRPAARTGITPETTPQSILVPVDGRFPSDGALQWASRFGESEGMSLTAMYVEPNVDEFARDVGQRIAERIVRRVLGSSSDARVEVVVGSSVKASIAERADQFGLLLLGANRQGGGKRWRRSSISESLLSRRDGPAVAVIRPAMPLTGRVSRFINRVLKARVPQLDRERRVSLVERVQGSSQWDFDFVALICLSTLIAAFGLVKNSSAVVIGAMLVAPLMTPLVGAGLSLVQGNRLLIQKASAAVFKGFVLAFLIGLVAGWFTPHLEVSAEMQSRGSPDVLDFVVALLSGIAAAYAMGRPNLLSALPGVAIAAALVPPIATAGLAASLGNVQLALGAMLLFVTNIVAIVLGTAAALWAIGIRPVHEHGVLESWVLRLAGALIVLAVVIAAYERVPRATIPEKLETEIQRILATAPELDLVDTVYDEGHCFRVVVQSRDRVGPHWVAKLREIVHAELDRGVTLEVETRLVTVATSE